MMRRVQVWRLAAMALASLALAVLVQAPRPPAAAADATGYRNPAANAADTGGDGNGYETNPTQAYTQDGAPAEDQSSGTNTTQSCTDAGKDRHRYYNYGFTVPSGARVDGVQVRIDARLDNASGYICVQLSSDGGATWTAAKQTGALGGSYTTHYLGGTADTWGRTWTSSELSNASFRVRVIDVANNTSARFRLDYVGVQVNYTPAPTDGVGPAAGAVAATPNPTAGASSVTLTAAIDDTATGSSNIAAAEYFVDATGSDGGGTAMTAVDGAFNGPVENVTASVNAGPLSVGDHTLYVHGRDAAGNWGPFASTVLQVSPASSLSVATQPVNFGSITLTAADQTVGVSPAPWRASDARGTGAGWNLTITSTDFTTARGSVPVTNYKVQVLPATITVVSGNTPPVSRMTSFQPLSATSPLKLLSADPGTGMGTYDFTPDFSLTVPASAPSGAYSAAMTVTINSGP